MRYRPQTAGQPAAIAEQIIPIQVKSVLENNSYASMANRYLHDTCDIHNQVITTSGGQSQARRHRHH